MNINPELIKRTRHHNEDADLALLFVEEELGRFDFKNNWEVAKAKGNVRERVQRWLTAINADNSPDDIISAIDQVASSRPGRWV